MTLNIYEKIEQVVDFVCIHNWKVVNIHNVLLAWLLYIVALWIRHH